jgi:hypothetical protein
MVGILNIMLRFAFPFSLSARASRDASSACQLAPTGKRAQPDVLWTSALAIWLNFRNYPVMRTLRLDVETCNPVQAIGNDAFTEPSQDVKSVASSGWHGDGH